MEMGNPNKTKAPALNQAIKCLSVPLFLNSLEYQMTAAVHATVEDHNKILANIFMADSVDRTTRRLLQHLFKRVPLLVMLLALLTLLLLFAIPGSSKLESPLGVLDSLLRCFLDFRLR